MSGGRCSDNMLGIFPVYMSESMDWQSVMILYHNDVGTANCKSVWDASIRCGMSWQDLVSAWNHAEGMIVVSPLTANVCIIITCHETFSFKCISIITYNVKLLQ